VRVCLVSQAFYPRRCAQWYFTTPWSTQPQPVDVAALEGEITPQCTSELFVDWCARARCVCVFVR
jgi:hypothetical protein